MNFKKDKINMVDAQTAKKTVFATGIGNAMEWFDFGVYAYTTAYIGANFFSPVQNPQIQQIFTFAALAIAFLLRPIGGIVFGIIGDKFGRKVVLTTTIILMALSTLTIGILPNYDMIGLWAPALLLLARVLQGFSTGGEYAGAMTYIAEISPDKKRNSLGSGLEIGTLSGYIAASIMIALLSFFLSDAQMQAWGWRIPFILGLFLGLFGLYLRRKLEESPVYENDVQTPERDNVGFFTILRYHFKDILVCFVAVVFFNVTNYTVTAYLPTYLGQIVKIDETTTSVLITCVMAVMIPLALFFGKMADKIGEKKVFLIGTGGLTLLSIVAFSLIHIKALPLIILGVFILGFFLSTYEATMPGSLPTMFFTHIRYRTLAVTFNVSVSLFGGTTPLINSWLVESTGNVYAPAYYLTAISLIGFIVIAVFHTSTAGKSLKGSYPNVDNKKDLHYFEEHPKKALWWIKEKKNRKA
ncbi:MFS transporter [Staphylococcus croceilyticus]|uniref:Putative proline/betaine transporter n=2 Tax=Staphylococcus croceilyticus TaxID=319942 RepID=A0ABY2KET1_9STAP|nr:MFS transporter [Staphylococcus croceilyticus]TGA73532.1 MFS transporter [Staphylococcus croceilyticus]